MARFTLILVLAALTTQSAMSELVVDSVDSICTLVDTSQLADPGNCKSYYECAGGTATKKSCIGSTVYDKNSMRCVPATDGECDAVTISTACVNKPVDSFVNNPSDCGAYYYCNSEGEAKSGQCPNGLNFNPINNRCDYKTVYPCDNGQSSSSLISGNVICLYMPSGVHFGDPNDCNAWNYCTVDNILQSGSCTNNNMFDLITKTCNYASKTACTQVAEPPTTGGPCTEEDPQQKGAGKKAPCNIYYNCSDSQYQLRTCPPQTYFDTDSCKVFEETKVLECNNCANLNKVFVSAPSDTGCSNYYYCINGTANSEGACENGLFFHQATGFCTETDPNYGWCKLDTQ